MTVSPGNDGVLVVGYGNGLRSDDGVGRAVAERLVDDPRLAGATVLSVHQLTPELAVDISRASVVVFIDAALGGRPGEITVGRLAPAAAPAAVPVPVAPITSFTHHLDAASLVALATGLFGGAPLVHLVTIAGASMDVGDQLSPIVAAALPQAVETVVDVAVGEPAATTPDERRRVPLHA